MKVLVTGANGQLGSDVVERFQIEGIDVCGVCRDDADVTNKVEIQSLIRKLRPDVVIHCAAYTNVDLAEEERDLCYDINVNGTRYIAEICHELDLKMIYISTDYVFNGTGSRPWIENDKPNPVNYYGETKYLGECTVKQLLEKYFIIRISWVFGKKGNNFIKTMIRLASEVDPLTEKKRKEVTVVDDQVGSPTYTYDLAIIIYKMILTKKYGVYHATNEGYCSRYEFACEIFRIVGSNINVKPIKSDIYLTKAIRPKNSRLNKNKLKESGFSQLPNWKTSVNNYINKELELIDARNCDFKL